jgi:hypothetical protein
VVWAMVNLRWLLLEGVGCVIYRLGFYPGDYGWDS